MFIKESQIRAMVRDLLLEQDYVEGAGGYEYTSKDGKIFITKSPRSKKASRENPLLVSQEKNSKAWNSIASRHFPELLDADEEDDVKKDKEGDESEKDTEKIDIDNVGEKDLATKDKKKKKSKQVNTKTWSDIKLSSWLRAEEDTIDAIYYNGKRYLSYGFAEHKGRKGAAVVMPFEEFRDLNNTSNSPVSAYGPEETIKLLRGGSINRRPKKGTRHVFIPWNTEGIELEISSLTFGAEDSTVGDQLAELISIPSGIPVFGIPADVANVFIYSSLEPPKWFAAFLSLFGVVPVLGEFCAILRGVKALRVLKNGGEAAKGVLKFINSSEPLRNTLGGRSLVSLLKDNRKFVFDILEDNIDVISKFGLDGRKVISGLSKFTDEFLKAYGLYAKYTGLATRKEIGRWIALTQRSLGAIIEDQIMNSKEVYEKVKATGIFAAFGVSPTGNLEADMESVSKKMETRAGDYTDEMIASLQKLETDVVEKSGVSVA